MDKTKAIKSDSSCELSGLSKKENTTETFSKSISPEDASNKKSEVSKDICKERDVKQKPGDPHTKTEVKNYQKAELTERKEANLDISSTSKKQKITVKETVNRKISAIQKKTKFVRVVRRKKRSARSLRHEVLKSITKKKLFPEVDVRSELSCKITMSQTDIRDEKSRAEKIKEKNRKYNPQSTETDSSFPNKFQIQRKSISNESSDTAKSASTSTMSPAAAMKSAKKIKMGEEEFDHFLGTNKESVDSNVTGGIRIENVETSDDGNRGLEDAKTDKESTRQSFGGPSRLETEYIVNEMSGGSRAGISATCDTNFVYVLRYFERLRLTLYRDITGYVELLMINKEDSKNENMQKRLKLADSKEIQKLLIRDFEILCDYEKHFESIKKYLMIMKPKFDFSNITSLTDLPLSATNILTIFSIFLYHHKSLYSKISIENLYKRINTEILALVYRRHRERKAVQKVERKLSKNKATKSVGSFDACLEKQYPKLKNDVPYKEEKSFEDYQNSIGDLKIAIRGNLTCLYTLISAGTPVLFPVAKYLIESRKTFLLDFLFLDKRRPNVFS